MSKEIIIDKYGEGHAVVVLDQGKIVDAFIDPPLGVNFYAPNTQLRAKIVRRISKMGGYFIKLPNGYEGFLKSDKNYSEGEYQNVVAKVFFDPGKAQLFTDKSKLVTKHFIIECRKSKVSFSRKISESFDRKQILGLLNQIMGNYKNISILCRSSIVKLNLVEIKEQIDKALKSFFDMTDGLDRNITYNSSMAKTIALKKFEDDNIKVIEEDGIFEQIGIWDQLESLCKKKIYFNDGSYLIIENTSAFCSIDVNVGNRLRASIEELNIDAATQIIFLIKILGLGGKIIIDFISCSKKSKEKIKEKIVCLLSDDYNRTKIWGWTKGGSFELERERDKTPIHLLLGIK